MPEIPYTPISKARLFLLQSLIAGCFAAAMSTLKLEASGPFSKTEEDVWNIIRTSSLKAEKI